MNISDYDTIRRRRRYGRQPRSAYRSFGEWSILWVIFVQSSKKLKTSLPRACFTLGSAVCSWNALHLASLPLHRQSFRLPVVDVYKPAKFSIIEKNGKRYISDWTHKNIWKHKHIAFKLRACQVAERLNDRAISSCRDPFQSTAAELNHWELDIQ